MKIQFVKDTTKAIVEDPPNGTVVVFHSIYKPPVIQGATYIEWEKYRVMFSEVETSCLILVGLNRMINPSNRCDMVNDYLQVLTQNIRKISIDNSPFIGEPWRLWYHYSVVFSSFMGINYSYPIEGEWQKWFYRETNECRLSADNLKLFVKDTYCDLDSLKTEFIAYESSPEDLAWYTESKEFIFAKYDSPKLLIQNLLKLCNQRFQTDIDFNTYLSNQSIKLPDLGVYRFMIEENERRMNIYNAFCQ
jgi:hypothetical protein